MLGLAYNLANVKLLLPISSPILSGTPTKSEVKRCSPAFTPICPDRINLPILKLPLTSVFVS